LPDYNWSIKVYYAVNGYYTEEILNELVKYNPTVKEYYDIMYSMDNFEFNTGFTFTNYSLK
jgi:hypothetical protein